MFTSTGRLSVPALPVKPFQNSVHAVVRLVLTADAALPVAVPPATDWTRPSTVVCALPSAVTALPSAVEAAVCARTALPSAVSALLTPRSAWVFTPAAAVFTSTGRLSVPALPVRPFQNSVQAVARFVLTVVADAPVALPPATDCAMPSTVFWALPSATTALPSAVLAAPCARTALPSAVSALLTPRSACVLTPAAAVFTSTGRLSVPALPVKPFQNSVHAVRRLVLTFAGAVPVVVPPTTDWEIPSTVVCALLSAATAFPSATTPSVTRCSEALST